MLSCFSDLSDIDNNCGPFKQSFKQTIKSNALNLHSFRRPAGGASSAKPPRLIVSSVNSLMVSGVIESNIVEIVHRLFTVYDPDYTRLFFCLFLSLYALLCSFLHLLHHLIISDSVLRLLCFDFVLCKM